MTERTSIKSVHGRGILRLLTPKEAQEFYPNAPLRQYMGFVIHGKVRLTFRLDECFDENGNFFEEAV